MEEVKKQMKKVKLKSKLEWKENEKGITLVALVVTIVVLLILAGVTIDAILGDNGIIAQARRVADAAKQAAENEQGDIAELTNQLANILNSGNSNSSSNSGSSSEEPTSPKVFSPDIIKEKATEFYGKTVNYTNTSNGVTTWRIFYADESNIYLIADDYISLENTPKAKSTEGTEYPLLGGNYRLYFQTPQYDYNLGNCYLGASDIYNNGKVKNMLKQYFEYTPPEDGSSHPNQKSENNNIKAVAYMLDTDIWSEKFVEENAEYAIGGPALEMFVESYKETHKGHEISCNVTGTNGYNCSNATGLTKDDYDKIYIKSDTTKASGMWLASPSGGSYDSLVGADCKGNVGELPMYESGSFGLRPFVCLRSGVQLKKSAEGAEYDYEIVPSN